MDATISSHEKRYHMTVDEFHRYTRDDPAAMKKIPAMTTEEFLKHARWHAWFTSQGGSKTLLEHACDRLEAALK